MRESRSGTEFERRWTRVGAERVHALVSTGPVPRDRPPVILVHGLGMSGRYMMPFARLVAPELRVHVPDLPGFGLSDKPARALSVPELAAALGGYMDAAGLGRADLFGNSLGCEVLVALALRHPERVRRLVLQGPTPDPADRTALQKIALFPVTAVFERWSLAPVALAAYLRGGALRYVRTFASMMAHRIEPGLGRVEAPTLVVWGTRDYLVPRRSVERFARLLPQGRLAVIEGAAHGMPWSHPQALCAAVLPFLIEAEASAAPDDTAR